MSYFTCTRLGPFPGGPSYWYMRQCVHLPFHPSVCHVFFEILGMPDLTHLIDYFLIF